MASSGDFVKIVTAEKDFEGVLMPKKSKDSVFVKLKNGYNIGISKKKIKDIKVLKKVVKKKTPESAVKKKKGLKSVVVLHTGGTIASKVNYETGGVSAGFSAKELLDTVPELKDIVNIDSELVENMMSEDMNFSDYKKMIAGVKKHMKSCDGIIIAHGTDTLTYTSAALSFVFENLPIPVLLVGSQRSSDRGSSDAAMNLICAARFIANSDFTGVAVCMHSSSSDDECAILPATKTKKLHTSRRDAFKAVNDSPIAFAKSSGEVNLLKGGGSNGDLVVKEKFSEKVGMFKVHPNLNSDLLSFMTKNYDAIVVEATGLGHLPTNTKDNTKNYELLTSFVKKGGILGVTSQCIFGRVHGGVYANLRRLSNIGAVFCEDMLSETAFIKLSWLLGNFSKEKAKDMLVQNLRGEISERSLYKEDFLE